jgi:PrcB C-terminal
VKGKYVVLIILILAYSQYTNGDITPRPLKFRTINLGSQGDYVPKGQRVVQTQDEWNALIKFCNECRRVKEVLQDFAKEIDFSKEMVLAVFQGTQPSGGYAIKIESVSLHQGKIIASVQETVLGKCGGTASLTSPFHIVSLRKRSEEVTFIRQHVVRPECR